MLVESIDNNTFVTTNHSQIRIWKKVEEGKWALFNEIDYQGLKVQQVIGNVKLRLGSVKNSRDGTHPHCLALLHKDGVITFWNLANW